MNSDTTQGRPCYNFSPITDHTKVFAAGHVPAEMKEWAQWCYCAGDDPLSQEYKRPRSPRTGQFSSTVTPSSWGTFDEAMHALNVVPNAHSIGFVFTANDPFVGIDVDEKHPERVTPQARIAHDNLRMICSPASPQNPNGGIGTYLEMSHSGTGFHAIFKGDKTNTPGKFQSHCDQHMIELFFHGCFLRMSGCQWQGHPNTIAHDDQFIAALVGRINKATPSAAMKDVELWVPFDLGHWTQMQNSYNNDEVVQKLACLDDSAADQSVVDLQLAMELCKTCQLDSLVYQYILTTQRGQRLKHGRLRWDAGYAARTIGHARWKLKDRPPTMTKENWAMIQKAAVEAVARDEAALKLPKEHRARVVDENYVAPAQPVEAKTGATFSDLVWPQPYPGTMQSLVEAYMHNSQAHQPEMALAASLCAMATAVSPRVITPTNCSTALYFLVFAPTGTGKNEMLRLLDGALAPVTQLHTGSVFPCAMVVHDVASREGLEQLWANNRALLWRKDEIADYLNPKPTDTLKNNLKEFLLSDFSHAPTTKRVPRARVARPGVKTPEPVDGSPTNLMGTCVPMDILDALGTSNAAKGVANRMLFVPGRDCLVDPFARPMQSQPAPYGGRLLPVPGYGQVMMTFADGARELCGQYHQGWLRQYHAGDSELFARMGELLIRVATVVAAQDVQNPLYTDQQTGAPLWYVQQVHVQWAAHFCGCCFETMHRLSTRGLGTQDAKDAETVRNTFLDIMGGNLCGLSNAASVKAYASKGLVSAANLETACTKRKLTAKAYESAINMLIRVGVLDVVAYPVGNKSGSRTIKCYCLAPTAAG